MSADQNLRPVLPQKAHQPPGVEFVKCLEQAITSPWLVEPVIEPAEQIGSGVNQIEICFRVEVAEELVCVVKRVDVAHFFGCIEVDECPFDGLSGAHMTRTGRSREHQNFLELNVYISRLHHTQTVICKLTDGIFLCHQRRK